MNTVQTCFCLLIIVVLVQFNQGGRYGGGSRGSSSRGSGGSSHSYSGSRSSSSWNTHASRPSSTVYRPPATSGSSYHPTPRRSGPISSPHFTTARSYQSVQRVTSRPVSQQQPTSYRQHTTPRTQNTFGRVTSRPVGQQQPTPYRQYTTPRTQDTFGRVTSRPVNQPRPGSPSFQTTPRRYTTPRSYVGSPTRASGWVLPPRPAQQQHYSQQGSAQHSYPSHSYTGYHGPSKVTIVNKYKYNYPGYYSLPVQSTYPGYYHAPTYYNYGSHDTGSTALGFFLGYGLGRLTTPTYSHYSFYDGYTPRYDHYTVHHYYHNRESIPQKQEIPSNTIIGCVGDSSTVCPSGTTSLCTSSGALMCVVSAQATTACANNIQGKCVTSVIPCINSTAPECQNSKQNTTTVSLPCISTAEVYGDIKYVDNTIIVDVPKNSTDNSTTTTTLEYSTKYPITTTLSPQTETNATASSPETVTNSTIQKRDVAPQNFCVTVVALPAKKEETQGEKLLSDAKDIASKFMESVWGL